MSAKKTILVVDDDVHVRKLLRLYLEAAAFDVSEAASGDEALRLWTETKFDLVLLDLILPQHGGFRLCQKFKEDAPQTVVVLMTGDDSAEMRQTAKESGADHFVPKPFQPQDLIKQLRNL